MTKNIPTKKEKMKDELPVPLNHKSVNKSSMSK